MSVPPQDHSLKHSLVILLSPFTLFLCLTWTVWSVHVNTKYSAMRESKGQDIRFTYKKYFPKDDLKHKTQLRVLFTHSVSFPWCQLNRLTKSPLKVFIKICHWSHWICKHSRLESDQYWVFEVNINMDVWELNKTKSCYSHASGSVRMYQAQRCFKLNVNVSTLTMTMLTWCLGGYVCSQSKPSVLAC